MDKKTYQPHVGKAPKLDLGRSGETSLRKLPLAESWRMNGNKLGELWGEEWGGETSSRKKGPGEAEGEHGAIRDLREFTATLVKIVNWSYSNREPLVIFNMKMDVAFCVVQMYNGLKKDKNWSPKGLLGSCCIIPNEKCRWSGCRVKKKLNSKHLEGWLLCAGNPVSVSCFLSSSLVICPFVLKGTFQMF